MMRKGRLSVVFTKIIGNEMPRTNRHSDICGKPITRITPHVYNFGFAVSEKTMYWKHMTAIGFSQKIKDSPPNEDWYEEKWLNWNPSLRNLEISRGSEHLIPMAIPMPDKYDIPQSVKERIKEEPERWKIKTRS